MTTGDEAKARELLANAKALLLDFDGPICSVFAGLPAPTVAEQLRVVLADGGHTDLPEPVATTGDPFDVFRYAATLGEDEARYVEATFTALEVEAIATAEPTPGAHELIHAWHNTGRPLAIVSNNSKAAVNLYLNLHELCENTNYVSGRLGPKTPIKPDPYLLISATNNFGLDPRECTFIGDSITDILAARHCESKVIGYANKVRKSEILAAYSPESLIGSLTALSMF